ncbi:hypothetical protein LBMAG42_57290 [Deltaproteobacteria bacterium]|nr:hypothetical protein LBMAG42_57290 [Deltaproteobacteria bacterium]
MFEGLRTGSPLQVGTLSENRRSVPTLLDAFNRVFSAMLPATDGETQLDPGSEMSYEALTWPEKGGHVGAAAEEGAAPVELIAVPGARWLLDKSPEAKTENEENTGKAEDEAADEGGETSDGTGSEDPNPKNTAKGGDNKPPTVVELATVARIVEIIGEREDRKQAPGHDGAHIAVLVHSWRRAVRYRELLARAGIVAVVQGGRGLLTTREVQSVLNWLRAAVNADNVALVGALRGPGVSLSDPALYCLRKGFGVTPADPAGWMQPAGPYSLRTAAIAGVLDPAAAVGAWPGLSEPEKTRQLLTRDAGLLSKFQERWQLVTKTLGRTPTHRVIEQVLDEDGIRAHWHTGAGGRQAAANLDAFVDLVRVWEGANGTSPRALLRHLDQMTGQDDPASGGLDAGAGAPVLITTYWQAKGREWPVVVLPDLELTDIADEASGLLPVRLVRNTRPSHLPSALATNEEKPFEAKATAVHEMSKPERMAAARAELRRLFYVAATRAKDRLVLSASISAPDPDRASWSIPAAAGKPKAAVSLDTANNWAALLRTTLALTFDRQGNPILGAGAWTAADIQVSAARGGEPTIDTVGTPKALGTPTPATWRTLVGAQLEQYKPSEGATGEVAPPLGGTAHWPSAVVARKSAFRRMSQEGTAFHAMMEQWGYGTGGEPEAAARRAMERDGLLPAANGEQRVRRLLELLDLARTKQPGLFAELALAAREGRVYHEIPLTLLDEQGRLVNGIIDLLWRDAAG